MGPISLNSIIGDSRLWIYPIPIFTKKRMTRLATCVGSTLNCQYIEKIDVGGAIHATTGPGRAARERRSTFIF